MRLKFVFLLICIDYLISILHQLNNTIFNTDISILTPPNHKSTIQVLQVNTCYNNLILCKQKYVFTVELIESVSKEEILSADKQSEDIIDQNVDEDDVDDFKISDEEYNKWMKSITSYMSDAQNNQGFSIF